MTTAVVVGRRRRNSPGGGGGGGGGNSRDHQFFSADSSSEQQQGATTPRDVWKKLSFKVIDQTPVGELTANEWHESISALRYWKNQDGVDADDLRWNLLDRLVKEESQQQLL